MTQKSCPGFHILLPHQSRALFYIQLEMSVDLIDQKTHEYEPRPPN